jgi:hypothetical protein
LKRWVQGERQLSVDNSFVEVVERARHADVIKAPRFRDETKQTHCMMTNAGRGKPPILIGPFIGTMGPSGRGMQFSAIM